MDMNKPNFDSNLKYLCFQESSASNEKSTPNSNMSNMVSYPQESSLDKINLNNVEERRKTLIFAAVADISKTKWKEANDNNHKIEYVEDVDPLEVATQIEKELLDCYRFSPLPNLHDEPFCLEINDQKHESDGNAPQSLQQVSKKGTQTEVGLLDLYSLSPGSIHQCGNDFPQHKEEKQGEDDIQGLTGLALLAGSPNGSPRISPKNSTKNSPRNSSKSNTPKFNVDNYSIDENELMSPLIKSKLNLKKTLDNQIKLVISTPRPKSCIENSLVNQTKLEIFTSKPANYNNFNGFIDPKHNDLQFGNESQNSIKVNPFVNVQFNNKGSTCSDLINSFHKDYYVEEPFNVAPLEPVVTTALVSSKSKSKKELNLIHKDFEKLPCRNEYKCSVPLSPKTPCKSSIPNFDHRNQNIFQGSERLQETTNDGTSKSKDDDLSVELNKRDCKEWFRERLWCFLFENLSRAVDELYFLCDLQGASEKMNEAVLFLEEACQDFKELKSSVGTTKTTTSPCTNLINFEAETSTKSNFKINGEEKKLEIFEVGTKLGGVQSNKETSEKFLPKVKITDDEEGCLVPKIVTQNVVIQRNEKQAADLILEEKTQNLTSEKFENIKSIVSVVEKKEMVEKTLETKFVIFNIERNHNDEKSLKSDGIEKKMEIVISEMQPQIKANEKGVETLINKEKSEATTNPNHSEFISGNTRVDGKYKKNFQSIAWEVFKRPPRPELQFENRNTDCKIGMIANESQSPFANKPQTPIFDGRKAHNSFGFKKEESEFSVNVQNRATSVIGYRVDEEQRKMVDFANNETPPKCKSNKKILQNTFTGRLMRPTESSNIRTISNLKIKDKERSKNKESHGTWTLTKKCPIDTLKQKSSWLDALATPRRGLSPRCQVFEKPQTNKNLNLIKKEMFLSPNFPKRAQIGQEIPKNNSIDDDYKTKAQFQNQKEIDSKLNDEKANKSKIGCLQSKTTKPNVYEYEVRHVEDRLANRLKEGTTRRLACLDEIVSRVGLISEDEKYNKPYNFSDFCNMDTFLNQKSPHKNKESSSKVDGLFAPFKSITFFQKQAMQKKIRNIRLKLAHKKIEFLEPPLGVEGVGIGFATATGLAKAKIGKWMDELRSIHFSKDKATTDFIVSEIAKYLEGRQPELHVARQLGLLDYTATSIPLRQDPTTTLGLLLIQKRLLYLPANQSYFIVRNLLPPLVPMLLSSLEIFTSFGTFYQDLDQEEDHEPNEDQIKRCKELSVLQEIIEGLLSTTLFVIEHSCIDDNQLSMQDDLVDLLVACGLIHQLQNLFTVFHWQQKENQAPIIPKSIIFSIKLIEALTGPKRKSLTVAHEEPINVLIHDSHLKQIQNEESTKGIKNVRELTRKSKEDGYKLSGETPRIVISQKPSSLTQSTTFLLAEISETGLVGLLSLLIGMILQVNPPFQEEEDTNVLPSNFNEAAITLLRVLNNVARLDLSLVQNKLALPDVCLEFYQLMSFLLTYCISNWKTSVDEIAALLLETMMFIGYAALLHPQNQALLQWGKSPTIIQTMCNLPFVFFSDSTLTPILIGTLLAICYGSETNRDAVQQQLSMEILLTFIKSSKTGLFHSINSTPASKDKEEIKSSIEKKAANDVKILKNDNNKDTNNHQSMQRLALPKTLFGPSKSMMAKEKLGMFGPSPSSPKGTRLGNMSCCSTTHNPLIRPPQALCSRLSKSLDFNDGLSSLAGGDLIDDVCRKNTKSPRLLNKSTKINEKPKITVMDPLHVAFELQNRFPEGLWTYAEKFFSSSTWMGQIVKCL